MDCRHAPIRPLKWQKSFRRGRSAADHRTVRVTTHLRFPIIRDRLKPGCSKVDRAPLNRNAGEALRPSMSSGYPSMRPPFPDEAFLRLPPYRRGVLRALALRVIPHAPAFPRTPLFASTSRAKAGQVRESSALVSCFIIEPQPRQTIETGVSQTKED